MILADKYENAMESLEMQFLTLKEQGDSLTDTRETKLDKSIFDKSLHDLNVTLHQTIQRLTFDEEQTHIFGEFIF